MRDDVLRALRGAIGKAYDVLGELGRERDRSVAFLARENTSGRLVALRLDAESAGDDPDFSLTVRRELDASIPARNNTCPECKTSLPGWSRFCTSCNADLSGHAADDEQDGEKLRIAARQAAAGRYDLLGEMPRAEGGGSVYFARQRDSGQVVALRLDPPASATGASFSVSVTQTIRTVDLPAGGAETSSPPPAATATAAGLASKEREPTSNPRPLDAMPENPGAPAYLCPSCGAIYEPGIWFCPRDGSPLKPRIAGPNLVGRIIAGRYRVIRLIGAGGMGQVYLAEHVRIGRKTALKIMNPALKNDPEALGRFGREAAHASRISHPNVATIHDFGETQDGLIFLAMEYAEGVRLTELVEGVGPLAERRALDIARQVAEALISAHDADIVHRDLKPDNIIVAQRGDRDIVKVVDFGIAKTMESSQSQRLTRTGYVVGTPRYMSPEQLIGEPVDGRTDIYALGSILFEMVVGEPAFGGPTGESVITKRLTEPPPSARARNPNVSAELDALIRRSMARDSEERFATAVAFRASLVSMAASMDATRAAGPPLPAEPTRLRKRDKRQREKVVGSGSSGKAAVGAAMSSAAAGDATGGKVGTGAARAGAPEWVTGLAARLRSAHRSAVAMLGRVPLPAWAALGVVVIAVVAMIVFGRGRDTTPPADPTETAGRVIVPPVPPPVAAIDSADSTVVAITTDTATATVEEPPQATATPGGTVGQQAETPARTTPPPTQPTQQQVDSTAQQRAEPPPTPPQPTAPSAAAVDSVRTMLRQAEDSEDYPTVFNALQSALTQITAMETAFPAAGVVGELRRDYDGLYQARMQACEEYRRIRLEIGLPAPECRAGG